MSENTPRYKHTDAAAGQILFLNVNLREQLIPGTFEYMLNELIGTKIDISDFDQNYKNDKTGASAIPPEVLIKLIIFGYYKGQLSSRKICNLNNENMVAKALTGDMNIHWTTIARFISTNEERFKIVFVKVLIYCNELGLIGGENYALDGLRLPSNASIENSGTKEQLEKRLQVYRNMAQKHLKRHLKKDEQGETDEQEQQRFEKRQKHLQRQIEKLDSFVAVMEDKIGKEGQALQSNVTDNESAMIHSSKGIIQGYNAQAVVDQKNQIIVSAEAFGTANEGEHLPVLVDSAIENLQMAGFTAENEEWPVVLCDANYFSEGNLRACEEREIEAIIPGTQKKRQADTDGNKKYDAHDFTYDENEKKCVCPNGKELEYKGTTNLRGGEHEIYQARLPDCKCCPYFSQCTWSKKEQSEITQGRKLLIKIGKKPGEPVAPLCKKMQEKLETEEYQAIYAYRIQIVEPVFANIRYCKGLDRFTLRGKKKVNGQWQLYCIVHNLGKCLNGYNEEKKCA